jgi:hypothetical protein
MLQLLEPAVPGILMVTHQSLEQALQRLVADSAVLMGQQALVVLVVEPLVGVLGKALVLELLVKEMMAVTVLMTTAAH